MRCISLMTLVLMLTGLQSCKASVEAQKHVSARAEYTKEGPVLPRGPETWLRDPFPDNDKSEFAEARAICAAVANAKPPLEDLPTTTERAALKGCNSHSLYYGIGQSPDYAAARECAFTKLGRDNYPTHFYEGEGVLATIYANGRGAKRNFDLALHFACQIDDAAFATDSRVRALAKYRQLGWKGSDFDNCDYSTSGVGAGTCEDHKGQLAEQKRTGRIARIGRTWSPETRRLFDDAYAGFSEYALTAHDMDCHGGTAHAACAIAGQQHDIESYLGRIEALLAERPLPKEVPIETGLSPATLDEADWKKQIEGRDESDREWLEANRKQAIAERLKFEPKLIRFARAALPHYSAHKIRVIFSDL